MQFGDHRLNTGVRPEPRNTTVKMAMQTPLDEPILELLDDPSDQQLTDVISKLQDNQDVSLFLAGSLAAAHEQAMAKESCLGATSWPNIDVRGSRKSHVIA